MHYAKDSPQSQLPYSNKQRLSSVKFYGARGHRIGQTSQNKFSRLIHSQHENEFATNPYRIRIIP